jgi:hypothetical protein
MVVFILFLPFVVDKKRPDTGKCIRPLVVVLVDGLSPAALNGSAPPPALIEFW